MALYDDASFIFLASGAAGLETKDASKVYNLKPAPVVSSGGAVAMSGFTSANTDSENSVTISGETATFVGDGTAGFTHILEGSIFEDNKKYKIVADFVVTTGELKVQSGGPSDNENIGVISESGTFTFFFAAASSGQNANLVFGRRSASVAYNFSVSNVSVFEVDTVPADFDITRGANLDATRVGPTGLIEKGRENLILQSNSFDTTWSAVNVTVTGGQEGYDGSSDAWELKMTGAQDGDNEARIRQTGISVSGVCTYSVFAKAGNVNFIRLIGVVSGSTNPIAYFDLSGNGSVTSSTASVAATSIESFGNGWFRVSFTHKGAANPITDVRINISDGDDDVYVPTGSFIYIQDSQLEAGLVATGVITTTSAAATAGIKEDEPRFEYPLAGGAPSLLLEPERTNLITHSEYFGAWSEDGTATVTLNQATSPEGVTNAALLDYGASPAGPDRVSIAPAIDASTAYSFSVFAKKKDASEVQLRNFHSGKDAVAVFDLDAGSFSVGANADSGEMENYGNGWYRCTMNFTSDSGDTQADLRIGAPNTYTDSEQQIYIYGAQFEEGLYASSYIPTHSAAATRSGEGEAVDTFKAQLPTALNGASAYTLFMDLTVTDLEEETDFRDVLIFRDSTRSASLDAFKLETFTDSGTSSLRGFVYKTASSSAVANIAHNTIAIGSRCKLAVVFNSASGVKAFYNGSSTPVINYSEATTYESVDLVQAAEATITGARSRTLIHAIHGYPSALSDAQCISLTTL